MSRTTYQFRHRTVVPADRARVHAVLVDLERYPEWWPQVQAVAKLDDDNALVVCRSTLPYDLELRLTALDRSQELLEVGIDGPISGRARWRLEPETGPGGVVGTRLDFEQQVRAEAPLFVLGSYLARPVLAWNHARMMRGCEEGLKRALGR